MLHGLWRTTVFLALASCLLATQARCVAEEDRQPRGSQDTKPLLATDGDGRWLVFWQRDESRVVAHSLDNGKTWSDAQRSSIQHYFVDVDAMLSGSDGGDWYLELSRGSWESNDFGVTWRQAEIPSTPSQAVTKTNSTPPGRSTTMISCCVSEDGRRIMRRRSEDGGHAWTASTEIYHSSDDELWGRCDVSGVSDGKGNWGVVWSQCDDGGDGPLGPAYLKLGRSTDDGLNWKDPIVINEGSIGNRCSLYGTHLATDGKGKWIIVWGSRMQGPEEALPDTDILMRVSEDNMATWDAPRPLNTNALSDLGDDRSPMIVTDKKGTWVVVWASDETLGKTIGRDFDILFSRSTDNGKTWSSPKPLNSDAATDQDIHTYASQDRAPSVACDGKNLWVVAWQSSGHRSEELGRDNDIMVARSKDLGKSWSDPAPLNSDAKNDYLQDVKPQITSNHVGGWAVLWTSENADTFRGRVKASVSNNGSKEWTPGKLLLPPPGELNAYSESGRIVGDSSGNWAAVYCQLTFHDSPARILSSEYTKCSRDWNSPSVQISPVENGDNPWGTHYEPDIAASAAGTWGAVWVHRNESYKKEDAGSGVAFSRRLAGAHEWTIPIIINPKAWLFGEASSGCLPRILALPSGRWLVVCLCRDTHGSALSSSILSDDGANWTTPVLLGETNGETFEIACSPTGACIAVWEDLDWHSGGHEKQSGDICFCRSEDGGVTWKPPALLKPARNPESIVEKAPDVATDGKGNWMIVWQSQDDLGGTLGPNWKILTSTSNDDGKTWSPPEPLSTGPAHQNVVP